MTAAKKLKSCKVCGDKFELFNSLEKVCGVKCAVVFAADQAAKREKKAALEKKRERRAEKRAWKEKNDKKWMLEQAQIYFNRWIRLVRDDGMPCQSCGKPLPMGKSHDKEAGHYKSRGAHSSLRFDESNVLLECHSCNHHSDNHLIGLRASIVRRFGAGEAERLDTAYAVRKWVIDDVRAIRDEYRKRCREAGV